MTSPESHSADPISVAILAGGASSRMGRDKALLTLDGNESFLERIDRSLANLSSDRFVVNRDGEPYEGIPIRTVSDVNGETGVLGGIASAIEQATNDRVFVVACDMPFVNAAVVELIAEFDAGADAVVPVTNEASRQSQQGSTWQVLHGVYRRSCLPAIEQCLEAGDLRAIAFLNSVAVSAVEAKIIRDVDPDLLTFKSINTPEDLEFARMTATNSRTTGAP